MIFTARRQKLARITQSAWNSRVGRRENVEFMIHLHPGGPPCFVGHSDQPTHQFMGRI